jgi:histidinol dehydrogenase
MPGPLEIPRIDTREPGAAAQLDALRAKLAADGDIVSESGRQRTIAVFGEPLSPREVVHRICTEVRDRGLAAVLEYTQKLDRARLDAASLRVPSEDLKQAQHEVGADFLAAIRRIRANIERFQAAILHRDVQVDLPGGGWLRERFLPLERVGICIPGGAAAYPSTVLMTAVPAMVAGVNQIAVVAPPTRNGAYNPYVLATCHQLGIEEVYRVGGAQAVAALAYGVEGVAKVDKIVGPGNLFVALAKRHVFGEVDIDSIAGPSEVVVIADASVPPEWVAADLIAQAEHAPGSSILITWDAGVIDRVFTELARQVAELARGELARESLEAFGALVVVENRAEAARLANRFAPEHLHIECEQPEEVLANIRHAGAIFIGPYAPVAVGDYAAGPSHVLPTGATARFASGLSANDFLRSGSVIHYSQAALEAVRADAVRLAEIEGLTGHAASLSVRSKK